MSSGKSELYCGKSQSILNGHLIPRTVGLHPQPRIAERRIENRLGGQQTLYWPDAIRKRHVDATNLWKIRRLHAYSGIASNPLRDTSGTAELIRIQSER